MTSPANAFAEFLARYDRDAVLFVHEVLGVEALDDWQKELLAALSRGERRISVRSGHGVGKTTVLAWAIVWWILCVFPQKCVCTAPTSGQLFDALANEVFAWISKLPQTLQDLLLVTTERVELAKSPNESFVSFRTSRPDTPEALAGIHAENVLLICDEASGIPEPVFEAASGSMSGTSATMILAGNPVRRTGLFYETHHTLRSMWRTIRVSCLDSPRADPDFVEQIRRTYGEESNAYRVRVLGEFPLADDDSVIPFALMETALTRDVHPLHLREIWGLDCARKGRDLSALACRKGNALARPTIVFSGLDTMQLVGRIVALWRETVPSERPEEICVDAIGIGAGVADRLRELDLPARAINVSESASLEERYLNLRAELWFRAREWFEAKDCSLAGDDTLGAELIGVTYDYTSNGKIKIEDKKENKSRTKKSPDRADAFVLTFAGTAITASGGTPRSWLAPLRRKIAGIV